ncbi:MAG TPA: hypothetical protein VFQ76_19325 [Longimicrobiaceae bacterium]|nr:hypothetical protein [Longimicrobiaceae bacterium]
MKEDERDEKRAVNPAMRQDAPDREPSADAGAGDGRPVKATQGAELDPRDEGGIAE